MNTDIQLNELTAEQRQGLETVVSRLTQVLRLCPDGDVSFEADEFIQSNVLGGCIATPRRKVSPDEENQFRQSLADGGTLFAVSRLFQHLDPDTASGYVEQIQPPGSQVWSCYNYVAELIQPWNRWRAAKARAEHGRASTSIASFLTPEEESRRAIAFQKIQQKIDFFASILSGVTPEEAERKPDAGQTQGFTKQDLCDLTGYTDGTVNRRLKDLVITTAGGGRPRKGDKPFSKEQVQRLLQSIIDDDGAQQFNKTRCEESLKTL